MDRRRAGRDTAPCARGERPPAVHRDAGRPRSGRTRRRTGCAERRGAALAAELMATATTRLVIVGGGIAGLSAAHRAVEIALERGLGLNLTLIEARERLGGRNARERGHGVPRRCAS